MMTLRVSMMAGTALLLTQLPQVALAQQAPAADDAPADGDIVVQARKRSELLSKIPETIDAITSDQITRAGITSVEDVGRQTPNIVLNRRQDNEPNVVIRGVGAFGNTQGIGFYIDDVQNFTDQTASIQDVERIEILKGPQGTLYGGSNVGGAVKYVLKKPGRELGAEAQAEYGTFDTTRLFGAVNVPAGDGFAMRVSGYYNRTDGYVRNTFLGTKADAGDEWGVRVAMGWQPIEGLDVQFSYRHNELSNGGFIYVTAADGADYKRTVDYDTDVFSKRKVDGGILSVSYEAGFADLTSVTSFSRRGATFRLDLDYSSADGVTAYDGDRNHTNVFTQELRMASSGTGPLDWLVGAYYASIDNRVTLNDIDLRLGTDLGGPLFIKDYNNGDTIERQYALFGTVNYRFGDFRIGGGLRVARAEFTGRDFNLPATTKVNDTIVLPKLTLAYDIDRDTMFYANFALGSEPGKVNVTTGTGTAYKPERATSVEAGVKGSAFDRRFSYDLAAFYIDYRKRQLENRFVNADGTITEEITNVGRSVSYGIEGGVSYRPIPELTLSASAGWLHSQWNDKGALFDFVPIDGLNVPNSPKFSGNASVDYRQPVGDGLEIGLRADVSHMGKFYWDVANASFQPSYDIVNLRASIGKPDAGWEISIRGENIFGDHYFTEYTPDVFGPGLGLGAPGMPARVLGSISFKF